jgi:multicomponent Na+:H+ antiporter subunit C
MRLDIMLSFIILLIGLYGLIMGKTVIKSIISLGIVQAAVILLFLGFAYHDNSSVPILSEKAGSMVDPLPQALMITAIVIGAAVTALSLSISIRLFHTYGTLNWKELMKRGG